MYVVNGICYAGNFEEDIKITDVKTLPGGMLIATVILILKIRFNDEIWRMP